MAQGKKKLANKKAPDFVKSNQKKTHKAAAKASVRKGSKKMKVKSFNDKLNVEIEKNIRMNIEEEMKVRAGKADKKEKQPKKK